MRPVLNTKAALVGSVLAGIGASACCVGPLLLLSLGIGGAWIAHLTALEPFRPIFIVLTLGFVALASYKLYFAPRTCTGDQCVPDQSQRMQRILFWLLVPLVLAFVASPWILPVFYR